MGYQTARRRRCVRSGVPQLGGFKQASQRSSTNIPTCAQMKPLVRASSQLSRRSLSQLRQASFYGYLGRGASFKGFRCTVEANPQLGAPENFSVVPKLSDCGKVRRNAMDVRLRNEEAFCEQSPAGLICLQGRNQTEIQLHTARALTELEP